MATIAVDRLLVSGVPCGPQPITESFEIKSEPIIMLAQRFCEELSLEEITRCIKSLEMMTLSSNTKRDMIGTDITHRNFKDGNLDMKSILTQSDYDLTLNTNYENSYRQHTICDGNLNEMFNNNHSLEIETTEHKESEIQVDLISAKKPENSVIQTEFNDKTLIKDLDKNCRIETHRDTRKAESNSELFSELVAMADSSLKGSSRIENENTCSNNHSLASTSTKNSNTNAEHNRKIAADSIEDALLSRGPPRPKSTCVTENRKFENKTNNISSELQSRGIEDNSTPQQLPISECLRTLLSQPLRCPTSSCQIAPACRRETSISQNLLSGTTIISNTPVISDVLMTQTSQISPEQSFSISNHRLDLGFVKNTSTAGSNQGVFTTNDISSLANNFTYYTNDYTVSDVNENNVLVDINNPFQFAASPDMMPMINMPYQSVLTCPPDNQLHKVFSDAQNNYSPDQQPSIAQSNTSNLALTDQSHTQVAFHPNNVQANFCNMSYSTCSRPIVNGSSNCESYSAISRSNTVTASSLKRTASTCNEGYYSDEAKSKHLLLDYSVQPNTTNTEVKQIVEDTTIRQTEPQKDVNRFNIFLRNDSLSNMNTQTFFAQPLTTIETNTCRQNLPCMTTEQPYMILENNTPKTQSCQPSFAVHIGQSSRETKTVANNLLHNDLSNQNPMKVNQGSIDSGSCRFGFDDGIRMSDAECRMVMDDLDLSYEDIQSFGNCVRECDPSSSLRLGFDDVSPGSPNEKMHSTAQQVCLSTTVGDLLDPLQMQTEININSIVVSTDLHLTQNQLNTELMGTVNNSTQKPPAIPHVQDHEKLNIENILGNQNQLVTFISPTLNSQNYCMMPVIAIDQQCGGIAQGTSSQADLLFPYQQSESLTLPPSSHLGDRTISEISSRKSSGNWTGHTSGNASTRNIRGQVIGKGMQAPIRLKSSGIGLEEESNTSCRSISQISVCNDFHQPFEEKLYYDWEKVKHKVDRIPVERLISPDRDGDVMLHLLIVKQRTDYVQAYLHRCDRCGITDQVIDLPNKNRTPLIWAVFCNMPEVVEMLLLRGADVNKAGKGMSYPHQSGPQYSQPIHLAVSRGITLQPILELLIKQPNIELNGYDFRGHTPLITAILVHGTEDSDPTMSKEDAPSASNPAGSTIDSKPIIELLIKNETDYSKADNCSGKTPIQYVVEKRDPEFLTQFLRYITDSPNLVHVSITQSKEVLRNLINTRTNQNVSTLQLAAMRAELTDGDIKVIQILLQNGAKFARNTDSELKKRLMEIPELTKVVKKRPRPSQ